MGLAHPRLRVVLGAVDQVDAVHEVLRDADVVVSAMGSGNATLTTFGENVISAMRRAGIARIVSLVGASVNEPGDPRKCRDSVGWPS
jgi:putative NADH-flavin reductase